ncbi:MAG: hypothetical protein IH899_09955, partial [Planctomycetes bacterium]|nr:hypothetical protein [Planctomycetota bacterium]
MRKSIGLLACAGLVAGSVWLIGSTKSVKTISAQEETPLYNSVSGTQGGAVAQDPRTASRNRAAARQFLDQARQLAAKGDLKSARSLAQSADRFPVQWGPGEETPQKFLQSLPSGNAASSRYNRFDSNAGYSSIKTADGITSPGSGSGVRFADYTAPSNASSGNRSGYGTFGNIIPLSAEQTQPFSAGNALPGNSGTDLSGLSPKQRAVALIRQARQDIQAGRYEEARRKAIQASRYNVSWTLFEERPNLILAEVERKTGITLIPGGNGTSAPAFGSEAGFTNAAAFDRAQPGNKSWSLGGDQSNDFKRRAMVLLAEARSELRQGNLQSAKAKALEAQNLGASYTLFEDRPKLVLQEIQRVAANSDSFPVIDSPTAGAPNNKTPVTAGPVDSVSSKDLHRHVQSLLSGARIDLKNSRIDEARQKAEQAQRLNVSYSLFDDRPEHIFQEILRMGGRLSSSSTQFPSPVPSFSSDGFND